MEDHTKFPSWIIKAEESKKDKFKSNPSNFFKKALECYPNFHSIYINCPKTSKLGILNTYDLSILEKYYEESSLREFIIFNIFETFHFLYVYQIREIAIAMHEALEHGAFYTAVILNRSIFESVCIQYYTFRRIEENFEQSLKYIGTASKTKSKLEQDKLHDKYIESLYDVFSLLHRANSASSINWALHLKQLGYEIENAQPSNRIHINDAIEDIEKASKLPLIKSYNLMSEFVHPNYGAKTLVINSKHPHNNCMDVLVIGDNAENTEAALFYIEQLSESLYYTLTLACSLHDKSAKFMEKCDKYLSYLADKRNLH